MSAEDGGPAYPGPIDYKQDGSPVWGGDRGMSLRDWFAGQALVGYYAHNAGNGIAGYDIAATLAYKQADAMLKARKV